MCVCVCVCVVRMNDNACADVCDHVCVSGLCVYVRFTISIAIKFDVERELHTLKPSYRVGKRFPQIDHNQPFFLTDSCHFLDLLV